MDENLGAVLGKKKKKSMQRKKMDSSVMPWLLVNGMRPWKVSSGVGSLWREPGWADNAGWKESSPESQTRRVLVTGLTLISSGVVDKALHLELLFPL